MVVTQTTSHKAIAIPRSILNSRGQALDPNYQLDGNLEDGYSRQSRMTVRSLICLKTSTCAGFVVANRFHQTHIVARYVLPLKNSSDQPY
jgi:hypothetical protein